jgi:hypothetical protein
MTEVFQDGEPVDAQKLRKMQADISAALMKAEDTYSLSKATANDVSVLNVTHTKAYRVVFENGLNKDSAGNTEDIIMDWNGYTDVFLTATPRGNLYKYNLQWSITGGIGSFKLTVNNKSGAAIGGTPTFDIIAAGTKPSKTA